MTETTSITRDRPKKGIKVMNRTQLQKTMVFLFKHLTKTQFFGLENIPTEGGVIIATNHVSRLDIPVLFINPVRPDVTALVTDKYLKYPFFRWFGETAGGIWLDRTKADFSAFGSAIEVLRQGRPLGIAPEGTRSTIRQLLPGKSGAVLLAQRAKVPIVPVGIAGTETTMNRIMTLRKGQITVRFGKPFTLPRLDRDNREEDLLRQTDEIMCQIAALLPESYHGHYANHPRLKELLAQNAG